MLFVTIKNQNSWLSIFPWNVKPVAEPNVTAIITEIRIMIIYNFLVLTNSAIKIRGGVSIGMANSEYSLWSWSNTTELLILISTELIFVNNGRKLVIMCNRSSEQS
jgi:hypothetical protein